MGDQRTSSSLQMLAFDIGATLEFESERSEGLPDEAGDPSLIVGAVLMLSSAPLTGKILVTLKEIISAWLSYRSEREIELKAGEYSVRIKGANEVESALDTLAKVMSTAAAKPDDDNCEKPGS